MANFPFSPDVERTAIVLAHRPEGMIADRVLPRAKVNKREFSYAVHDRKSLTSIPQTLIGRKSAVNQVEFGSQEVQSSVRSYGLSTAIPNDDERNAPAGNKPSDSAVTSLYDLIALDREKRVADIVFAAETYGTNTGTPDTKWSTLATSNPIGDLKAARDACLKKPNKLIIGKEVWSVLCTHPKIVAAVHGITDSGIVREAQIAQLFDVAEVIVGETWHDSAPKGKDAVKSWLWGKHVAFLHVAQNPAANGGSPTFGFTAEYEGRRVLKRAVTMGLQDGIEYLVGEDVRELVTAPDLGYLLTSVIA